MRKELGMLFASTSLLRCSGDNLRKPKCAAQKNTSICAKETNFPKQKFNFENSKHSYVLPFALFMPCHLLSHTT